MPQHTNRLIHETSPYLLQHAHNPVDWHPWGEEAHRAAREQDKPILLSIGYSACHWCHVMEHESFENEEIARLMNENFISIKVDREERPDLDAIYMNFVQMTTGSGGWPMTVFLTPDHVPFFGGTYFPPDDRYGRPGFARLLQTLAELYRTRRGDIEGERENIVSGLRQAAQLNTSESDLDESLLDQAFHGLLQRFDNRYGGFGGAPKFPASMALAFLLRYHKRKNSDPALDMVNTSLTEMARGGIYDQLGGGFHRYSVDDRWLVPHFEKMLYDNALLSRVYLEAWQVTGDPLYRQVVKETLDYVRREMTDAEGGFYSAQDADSEGEEGKFFVWTPGEIKQVLGADDAALFCDYFDVTPSGNFEGKNILHHRVNFDAFSRNTGKSKEELEMFFAQSKAKLFAARERRVKPGRDEKVLAAWNGMMLAAFSEAAFALNDSSLLQTATRNAEFLTSKMMLSGRLRRSWKQGQARLNGYLDDYAQVAEGLLALYQASGESNWLQVAVELAEVQLTKFFDEAQGDFYFTASDHEALLVRQKEYFDNATPSGNAVTCLNLLRLSELTGEAKYRATAERMLRQMGKAMAGYSTAFGCWLQALDFFLGPVSEIAIVGPAGQRDRLLQPMRRRFLPNKVLALADGSSPEVEKKIPLLAGRTPLNGRATAYVCRNYTCSQPVTEPQELEKQLTLKIEDN